MSMLIRTAYSAFSMLLGGLLSGQVLLDKPLELSGTSEPQRQVTGVPNSVAPQAMITAATEQQLIYRTATPAAASVWAIEQPALSVAPPAGTHLIITTPETTAGAVTITVNGHGPYPLLHGPGEPMDGEMLPTGTPLSVVSDGEAFHVINGGVYGRKPCAPSTVQVNEKLCIEQNEHPPSDFFAAVTTCGSAGLRLCGWGEFAVACQRATELGLTAVTNSWEWTRDASNENGSARIVGATSCFTGGNALVVNSTLRAFRCCYSR